MQGLTGNGGFQFSNEGVIPEHRYAINQLNQRKADKSKILK